MGVFIYTPFFHRDDERLPWADCFMPSQWLDRDPSQVSPFVPFSAGPAACPGRHLVTLIGTAWLAEILCAGRWELVAPKQLMSDNLLPAGLDHFAIRLRLA